MNEALADQFLHTVRINEDLKATRAELTKSKDETKRAMDLGTQVTHQATNVIAGLERAAQDADARMVASEAAADSARGHAEFIKAEAQE